MSYKYRSHLTAPPPQPYAAARAYFQQYWSASDAFFAKHPALDAFRKWMRSVDAQDAIKSRDRTASGLLNHLAELQQWPVTREEIEEATAQKLHKKGRARSNRENGCRVDDELVKLARGRKLKASAAYRYTKWVVTYLAQRGWIACGAQVPLWISNNTVRTWADLIVYDTREKRIILIELKTGYDNYYDRELSRYNPGTMLVRDTARTRHQFQLGWMANRLRQELPESVRIDACVLRVSSDEGVRAPEWLIDEIKVYYEVVYEWADEEQPAKKRARACVTEPSA